MIFQTLYYLVDLYFVARLGGTAIAGVSAAGNIQFIIMALTQVLGVGTMVLVSHASGRKDREDANLIYNQSLMMSAVLAVFTFVVGFWIVALVPWHDQRRRGDRRSGYCTYLRLVHAGHGAAVRPGVDGLGASRNRDREADDGRAGRSRWS